MNIEKTPSHKAVLKAGEPNLAQSLLFEPAGHVCFSSPTHKCVCTPAFDTLVPELNHGPRNSTGAMWFDPVLVSESNCSVKSGLQADKHKQSHYLVAPSVGSALDSEPSQNLAFSPAGAELLPNKHHPPDSPPFDPLISDLIRSPRTPIRAKWFDPIVVCDSSCIEKAGLQVNDLIISDLVVAASDGSDVVYVPSQKHAYNPDGAALF